MPNERISFRLPMSMVERIDALAASDQRNRNNWIVMVLTSATSGTLAEIKALQVDFEQRTSVPTRMVATRLPDKTIRKLDAAAKQTSRSRHQVVGRLLAGALQPGAVTKLQAEENLFA